MSPIPAVQYQLKTRLNITYDFIKSLLDSSIVVVWTWDHCSHPSWSHLKDSVSYKKASAIFVTSPEQNFTRWNDHLDLRIETTAYFRVCNDVTIIKWSLTAAVGNCDQCEEEDNQFLNWHWYFNDYTNDFRLTYREEGTIVLVFSMKIINPFRP